MLSLTALTALVGLVLLVWSPSLLAQTEPRGLLLGDVKIESPGAAVPARVANFSGIWDGVWSGAATSRGYQPKKGGREVTIAIEKIEPPRVTAVYAWGAYEDRKGGWRRLTGGISGDHLVLEWGEDSVIQIILKPTGNPRLIEAAFVAEKYTMTATLKKR